MNIGKFIVFEGPDGVGKTTQVKLLADWLISIGVDTWVTKEPTEGPIGSKIRSLISNPLYVEDRQALETMFRQDRYEHLFNEEEGIVARLERGQTVICDRYLYSSYAYNTYELDAERVEQLYFENSTLPQPDILVLIDIDSEVALSRVDTRGETKMIYENKERQILIREKYLYLYANRTNPLFMMDRVPDIFLYNGDTSVEELAKTIKRDVLDVIYYDIPILPTPIM